MDHSIRASHIYGQGVTCSLWVPLSTFVKRDNKPFCIHTASERTNWGNTHGKNHSIRGMLVTLPFQLSSLCTFPPHVGAFSAGHVPPPPALNLLCIASIVLYLSHHCDYLALSWTPPPTGEVLNPRGTMCSCSKPDKMGTQA